VQIEGTKHFAAPPARVWDALVDPELLAGFLPGVQSLQVADDSHWSAVMRLPMSPVSLTLRFELRERARPDRALLQARGKRFGGSADVETTFDLVAAGEGTEMGWAADIRLGGTLSRLGPMLRPVAQQQAERFLDRLERRLGGG
jgi:carbon monoxide dehydrogenase subunit G